MERIIAAVIAFPTVIFTALAALAVVYWLVAMIAGIGDGDGGDGDHDADGHGHVHALLDFLGIGTMPLSLVATVLFMITWLVCMAGELLLREPISARGVPQLAYGLAMLVVAPLIGGAVTGFAVRPLRPLFAFKGAATRTRIEGGIVTVTSLHADESFGTAFLMRGGDEIIINVVCRPGTRLAKGEQGVVVGFDDARDIYTIAPLGLDGSVRAAEERPAAEAPGAEPRTPSMRERA